MKKTSLSQSAFFNPRVLIGFILCLAGAFLALIGFGAFSSETAQAAAPQRPQKATVQVVHSYHNDVSRPLRTMAMWPPKAPKENEEREANINPKLPNHHKDKVDAVVQKGFWLSFLAPNIPSPILNFDGIPFPGVGCNCAPPDTNGEVGATQYVQMVNEGYQVFNKTTGASELGPNSIESLWSGFGGVCESNGHGDPVVLYDQLANRWLISQFAGTGVPTDECVAVSTTNDATGTYNRYGFHLCPTCVPPIPPNPPSNFFDYPHLGVWPDAYYMSMNVFNPQGTAFLGPQAFAFDRAKMLLGQPATFVTTGITGGSFEDAFLPSDLDGSTLPPAGAPNSFVEFPSTGVYKIYHFHADFATPANTTFTLFASPPAAGFTLLCPTTRNCVPQLGTATRLDGIGDRLMFRLAYRNFGGHESVVGNFSVNSGGVAGVRWFELRDVTSGPATVFQESTYQPDTTWRWMGSVAMDGSGNMAVGYSASSASINPQIRYAGRLANDPINTLGQGEAHMFDGTGSQSATGSRWGDYSAMTIDPVDDHTFWYTQEYYQTTGQFNWRTRIANFKFVSAPTALSAVSRKTHGGAGTFDVNLPLTGNVGIECRTGGATSDYSMVVTFASPVTVTGSPQAQVTSGTALIGTGGVSNGGAVSVAGAVVTVPLTSVANAQRITVQLSGVSDGTNVGDVSISMGILIGDTGANGTVNASDVSQTKAQSGQTVGGGNFREDVNTDGSIGASDISLVKAQSGTALP